MFNYQRFYRLTFLTLLLLMAGMFLRTSLSAAAVNIYSDEPDYMIGDTAIIYGHGFPLNYTITVQVIRADGSIVKGDGTETPGSDSVITDSYGNLVYLYSLSGGPEAAYNGTITVHAIDPMPNPDQTLATTTFLDSPRFLLNGCSREKGDCEADPSAAWANGTNPMNGWTSGNLKGWYEGEDVPYRLRIALPKSEDAGTYYIMNQHDYKRSGIIGVDSGSGFYVGVGPGGTGTEGALTKNCTTLTGGSSLPASLPYAGYNCVVMGPTYTDVDDDGDLLTDEDPVNGVDDDGDTLIDEDPQDGSPVDQRIQYTWAVKFDAGEAGGNDKKWALYWMAHLATGSSNYPGASLHASTTSTGNQDVPIMNILASSGNNPPVANDDVASTTEDTSVVIDVLINDTDSDGTLDPATVTVVSGPVSGTTSVNTTTGEITYTPYPGFFGLDSFSYTVDDNLGAASNIATVYVTVNAVIEADLSIIKTDSPDPIDVGLNLTYNITVTNNGPSQATGGVVEDNLPPSSDVSFMSATPSQGSGCSNVSGTVTCNLGSLAAGASATVTIVVQTLTSNEISNTAIVSSGVYDPDPSDNSATAITNGIDNSRLINISTRGPVMTGDNVMIGGFVIGGYIPKAILVRAHGPTLADFGVTGPMANPYLELYSGQTLIAFNDNWQTPITQCDAPATACGTPQDIQNTGLAPCTVATTGCTLDSAMLIPLPPGAYTAILRGVGGGTGVGLIGIDDPDSSTLPKLVNISTRGLVLTGDSVMIGGFIIGQGTGDKTVLIRCFGPTLQDFGVTGALADPYCELYSGQGRIASNNNWQTPITQCDPPAVSCGTPQDIQNTGLDSCTVATTGCSLDSSMIVTLPPGPYTVIMRGVGGGTGVGLIGIDELGP